MEDMGSDLGLENLKEFDGVSVLVELHEGSEINVKKLQDVEFNEHEEHIDDDIFSPIEMPLVIYTHPQLGIEKT